ncbi:leucine-rich repeat-containing protein 71 isoform X2 [Struthio camelus]|uniref:leucine-rich repeat-containing protein 71 isoform X2 n=1 Tax=Struthio camelus TaxID=8801 RepID=UPI0036041346
MGTRGAVQASRSQPSPSPWAMRKKGERAAREKVAAAALEEEAKSAARKAEQAEEEYQCTGILEQDFPQLCARAGLSRIPRVTLRPAPTAPGAEESETPADKDIQARLAGIRRKYSYFQPCVQVEIEHDDPRNVREIFLRGWKIEEKMLGILSKCLPTLANLQALHLWKVGVTDLLLPSLAALLMSCTSLRTLSLEGNPLPEHSFYKLMGNESTLAHLSLRNNDIGDAAAKLIGQSLSTLRSSNRSLVSLVLSFNHISDVGAGYIAEGLRLNRSLLSLSLSHNDIGDAGALRLAEVLAPFALTHTEVVERRWLLLKESLGQLCTKHSDIKINRLLSLPGNMTVDKLPPGKQNKTVAKKKEPSRKEEKGQPGPGGSGGASSSAALPGRKEDFKQTKKSTTPPDPKATRTKGVKPSSKEKRSPTTEMEAANPLLEQAEHRDGKVFLPGNRELINLNLAYNHITEQGLRAFLAVVKRQQQMRKVPAGAKGKPGLLRLSLQKNCFPPACEAFVQLQELLLLRDPVPKRKGKEEEQGLGA